MLKLIYAPDPILKKDSVSIPQVDDHHKELIKQMYEVMYSANGVGLAAPQIGLNIRIFILDASPSDEEKKPITIINPKIITLEKIQCHMRKAVYLFQNILQKLIVLKVLR